MRSPVVVALLRFALPLVWRRWPARAARAHSAAFCWKAENCASSSTHVHNTPAHRATHINNQLRTRTGVYDPRAALGDTRRNPQHRGRRRTGSCGQHGLADVTWTRPHVSAEASWVVQAAWVARQSAHLGLGQGLMPIKRSRTVSHTNHIGV